MTTDQISLPEDSMRPRLGDVHPYLSTGTPFTRKCSLVFEGKEIVLVSDGASQLWIPEAWVSVQNAVSAWEAACDFLSPLSSKAIGPGWIVGSYVHDISGNIRDSKSHREGRAIDISPLFDEASLVDPTGRTMGLAWNELNLLLLAEAKWRDHAAVVEGDHIHIQLDGVPSLLKPGDIITVWTLSPWYRLKSVFDANPAITKLAQYAHVFNYRSLCKSGPSQANQEYMLRYLGMDRSNK